MPAKAIALLQSWIEDGDEQDQKATGEMLIRMLDQDRLPGRKHFPREKKGRSW